jgi:hypothetical protein
LESSGRVRAWIALVQQLSQEEISRAVDEAERHPTREELDRLCKNVNAALLRYAVEQMFLHGGGASASACAKHLRSIAKRAAGLIEDLGEGDHYSKVGEAAALYLMHAANIYGEHIGGYPGLPPRAPPLAVDAEEAPIELRIDYRGWEKITEIIKALSLLRDLADTAYRTERAKVEVGMAETKRYRGDPAMAKLFSDFDLAWRDAFGDVPTTGGRAGGPYVRFVSMLLKTYREGLPAVIDRYFPGLREGLDLTPDAIRQRVRQVPRPDRS